MTATTIRPVVTIKPAAAIRKANAALNDLKIDYSELTSEDLDGIKRLAAALVESAEHVAARSRREWIGQRLS
jgi:hypothetical protein